MTATICFDTAESKPAVRCGARRKNAAEVEACWRAALRQLGLFVHRWLARGEVEDPFLECAAVSWRYPSTPSPRLTNDDEWIVDAVSEIIR